MVKITFMGAGSSVFAKNVLGDCMLTPEIGEMDIALFDIDPVRLEDSRLMLENINKKYNGKARIKAYTDRIAALEGADFIVNAVQVGGYEPCTVSDFEIPKKYGLRQTIADTLGVGGIFRALRTIPVLEDFAEDKEEREKATKQFNTRLPVKEYDEITFFLKEKKIPKVDLIRMGYQALLQEFKKED